MGSYRLQHVVHIITILYHVKFFQPTGEPWKLILTNMVTKSVYKSVPEKSAEWLYFGVYQVSLFRIFKPQCFELRNINSHFKSSIMASRESLIRTVHLS